MTATERLAAAAQQRVDIASLAALRLIFGAVMFASTLRFALKGWIQEIYLDPPFHFAWLDVAWLRPWPAWGMALHFALMGGAALGVALGWRTRGSLLVFLVLFTWLELLEKATYLNHYYLVSLLAGLLLFLPVDRALSLDARRDPTRRAATAPAWCLWTLRAQIGLVYVFAGVAKLQPDWLLHGQPLKLWLSTSATLPGLEGWLAQPWVALGMSWAGAFFDLTVPFWLLWPRSRRLAYLAVIGFHAVTGLLFNIGIFPLMMIGLTPIFFAPDWPRRLLPRAWQEAGGVLPRPGPAAPTTPRSPARRLGFALLGAYALSQVALPLRALAVPGPVLWREEGMRFAWRVMVVEKAGYVTFKARDPQTGRQWDVSPREELTPLQSKMMSTQPDLILAYARHLARRFAAEGVPDVELRAESWASMNGRPAQRLVDPEVDLARVKDGFGRRRWVLDLEEEKPQ